MKRRALITWGISLLALALLVPAANAKMQTRYLEGLIDGGGRVRIAVDYIVRDGGPSQKKWIISNGKKQFIPKYLTFSATYKVPVTCDQGNTTVGHSTGWFPDPPPAPTFHSGTFSYALGTQDREGKFGGGLWHKGKRARATGILKWIYTRVENGTNPDFTRCTTNGPKDWTAHQCLRKGAPRPGLPLCRKSAW